MKRLFWFVSLSTGLYALIHAGPIIPVGELGVEVAPEELLAAAFRLIATGIAGYLLLVMMLDVTTRASGLRWFAAVNNRISSAAVRQLVGATLSISTLTVAGTGPAMARPAQVVGLPSELRDAPIMHQIDGPTTTTAPTPLPADPAIAHPAENPPVAAGGFGGATEWTVRPGDSFWTIAETLAPHDIEATWLALIDANRDRLADRNNPDLLLPGQTLAVPVSSGS